MSKVILICISGTGQEASDAKDSAIDNPLKIAVRGGGKDTAIQATLKGNMLFMCLESGRGKAKSTSRATAADAQRSTRQVTLLWRPRKQ